MSFANIPEELKVRHQWVVWRLVPTDTGKPTKLPFNALTGRLASHSDPSTWSTFELACSAFAHGGYDGIGYVFAEDDDYCGIDLDATEDAEAFARQKLIYELANSYSELSPSGSGLHIITKAKVPHGRKRASIEIYSSLRYFTMTGNVYGGMRPIEDRQDLVLQIWGEMGAGAQPNHYAGDAFPQHMDDDVHAMASKAVNGDLYLSLFAGNWADHYASQSEADLALINIIAYYTKNRAQISRMFRASGLGKRDKAQRSKYVEYNIDKAFDQTLPPVDLSGILDQVNAAIAASKQPPALPAAPVASHSHVVAGVPSEAGAAYTDEPPQLAQTPDDYLDGFNTSLWRTQNPPKLLRLMRDFIHASAPRPVKEIALAGALGLMSGMCGRAFNVSGTGLNHYIMMIAATGSGKEAMQLGVDKIINAASHELPSAGDFLGPADIASGQALLKHLSDRPTPSFVTVTGEIGMRLQQMSDPRATSAELTLRRVLLDLFNKSGAGQSIRPTIYSDKKNNTEVVHSPAFSLLGESTPEEFYRALDETQVSSGLLPRFMMIEYDGPRPPLNEWHASHHPSKELIDSTVALARSAHENMQAGKVINIGTTSQARDHLTVVNGYADNKINQSPREVMKHLWNRVHLKTYKLAGLLAISNNQYDPMIDHHMVEWAFSLIMTDTTNLLSKFEAGVVGKAESFDVEQMASLQGMVQRYLHNALTINATNMLLRQDGLISASLISQQILNYAPFRKDRGGASRAVKRTIETMIEHGHFNQVPPSQIREKYQFGGVVYAITNASFFLNA